jgi:uncharacterized protein (TIGR00290 family)
MKEGAIVAWSGGKDSAMALYELTRDKKVEIAGLLTTISEGYDRVSIHGVRRELLRAQAASLGLPLTEVFLPKACTYADYEERMLIALEAHRRAGVTLMASGDLYLEYARQDRLRMLSKVDMQPLFPLWDSDTRVLATKFAPLTFRAVVTCIDTNMLDRSFAGREYDAQFLEELPGNVDPCGENGEFHTFVYNAPNFRKPVEIERGVKMARDNELCYCDLRAAGVAAVGER